MALHNGIDTLAFASGGVYSETFGQALLKNRCNLFAFYGMLDDAPNIYLVMAALMDYYRRMRDG